MPLCLGGLLFPSVNMNYDCVYQDLNARLQHLRTAPTSTQNKWLLTLHISSAMSHMARVSPSPLRLPILDSCKHLLISHTFTLFSIVQPTRSTPLQLFAPIAKGGLGLADLRAIHTAQRDTPKSTNLHDTVEAITFSNWERSWIDTDEIRYRSLQLPTNQQASWVNTLPTYKSYTLSDSSFIHGIQWRLDLIQPFDLLCGFQSPDPHTFGNHIQTCKTCASATWAARHEAVIGAITRASNISHYQTTTNVDNLPLPTADTRCGRKSGPDILLMFGTIFALDVTVVHTSDSYFNIGNNRLEQRNRQKHDTYTEWSSISKIPAIPCTVSSHGSIHPEFIRLILDHAPPKSNTALFSRHIQTALVTATSNSIILLQARSVLTARNAERLSQPT